MEGKAPFFLLEQVFHTHVQQQKKDCCIFFSDSVQPKKSMTENINKIYFIRKLFFLNFFPKRVIKNQILQ